MRGGKNLLCIYFGNAFLQGRYGGGYRDFLHISELSSKINFETVMYGLCKKGGKVWVRAICIKVALWKVRNLLVLKGKDCPVKECLQFALFKLRYCMR